MGTLLINTYLPDKEHFSRKQDLLKLHLTFVVSQLILNVASCSIVFLFA